jgi:L-threonylcarbamoyladenylate synthase
MSALSSHAAEFERCLAGGGLAVFPSDTVYGLACNPLDEFAVQRLYLLKGRSRDKPCAVMFFDLDLAMESLSEVGARTRVALGRVLPGPVGVLLPNPAHRFPLACGDDPNTLGCGSSTATFGSLCSSRALIAPEALIHARWPRYHS